MFMIKRTWGHLTYLNVTILVPYLAFPSFSIWALSYLTISILHSLFKPVFAEEDANSDGDGNEAWTYSCGWRKSEQWIKSVVGRNSLIPPFCSFFAKVIFFKWIGIILASFVLAIHLIRVSWNSMLIQILWSNLPVGNYWECL